MIPSVKIQVEMLPQITITGKQLSFMDHNGTLWYTFVDGPQIELGRRSHKQDHRVMVGRTNFQPVQEDIFLIAAAAAGAVVTIRHFEIPGDTVTLFVSNWFNVEAGQYDAVGWTPAKDLLQLPSDQSRKIYGGDAGPWTYCDGFLTNEAGRIMTLVQWIHLPGIAHRREESIFTQTFELDLAGG